MNWARPSTRLAIYLRDGMACAYCGATVESGARLSLDHLIAHTHGGTNAPANLVTACMRCNDSRGARPLQVFARAVAAYLDHGIEPRQILAHVRRCTKRDLAAFRAEARELIARRGTVAKVLATKI